MVIEDDDGPLFQVIHHAAEPDGLRGVEDGDHIRIGDGAPAGDLVRRVRFQIAQQEAELGRKRRRVNDGDLCSPAAETVAESRLAARAIPVGVDMRGEHDAMRPGQNLADRLEGGRSPLLRNRRTGHVAAFHRAGCG